MENFILIRNSHESVRDCDVRDMPDIMECGGKRSATPLCRKSRPVVRQNQRSRVAQSAVAAAPCRRTP
jgi:hypothetical protein